MKRTLVKSLALAFVGSLLVAGSAFAVPTMDFSGAFSAKDTDNDGFRETLDLNKGGVVRGWNNITFTPVFFPGAVVTSSTESVTEVIGDGPQERVVFSLFTLDPLNRYAFNPSHYENGFTLYDHNENLLMTADLDLTALILDGATARGNSSLSLNMTDVILGTNYVTGSSSVIDSLYAAYLGGTGGALVLTFNLSTDFAQALNGASGTSVAGSFSGSVAPVPEPAAMLLLGTGLVGLAGARRRMAKK